MNRMSEGNTFYGRKLHITSCEVSPDTLKCPCAAEGTLGLGARPHIRRSTALLTCVEVKRVQFQHSHGCPSRLSRVPYYKMCEEKTISLMKFLNTKPQEL